MGTASTQHKTLVTYLLMLAVAVLAQAQFEKFHFPTTEECPGLPSPCKAPQACAQHTASNRWYCCGASAELLGVCWADDVQCRNETIETQTICGRGSDEWCCLGQDEKCTENAGVKNKCWSTSLNILTDLDPGYLGVVRASLSSASPEATTLSFDATALAASYSASTAQSATTTGDGSSSTDQTSASSMSTGTSTARPNTASESLSGGGIGGIIVGVIGGLAIAAMVVFFIRRRRRSAVAGAGSPSRHAQWLSLDASYGHGTAMDIGDKDAKQMAPVMKLSQAKHELPGEHVSELPVNSEPRELDGR